MILKKITLNNIRSYEHQEVKIHRKVQHYYLGILVLEKLLFLLGIEFALFGLQPGQRGSLLLRNTRKTRRGL